MPKKTRSHYFSQFLSKNLANHKDCYFYDLNINTNKERIITPRGHRNINCVRGYYTNFKGEDSEKETAVIDGDTSLFIEKLINEINEKKHIGFVRLDLETIIKLFSIHVLYYRNSHYVAKNIIKTSNETGELVKKIITPAFYLSTPIKIISENGNTTENSVGEIMELEEIMNMFHYVEKVVIHLYTADNYCVFGSNFMTGNTWIDNINDKKKPENNQAIFFVFLTNRIIIELFMNENISGKLTCSEIQGKTFKSKIIFHDDGFDHFSFKCSMCNIENSLDFLLSLCNFYDGDNLFNKKYNVNILDLIKERQAQLNDK